MTTNYNTNHQLMKMKTSISPKNCKRNIWFNPPFSKNVSKNIGKYFLPLIQKHFPNNHKYHKIFNKNNVKVSYSSMTNIKSVINMHNKKVITEKNRGSKM